jgi:cytidine deaminase
MSAMNEKELTINYQEYNSVKELDIDHQQLLRIASDACLNAYAPYSGFKVGAAVMCDDGRIFKGNNQENAAYPSGICAERVAIFSAMADNKDTRIRRIAIAIKTINGNSVVPVAPCGSCRQVIAEYEHKQGSPIELMFSAESGKTIVLKGIETLLPFVFNSDYLP